MRNLFITQKQYILVILMYIVSFVFTLLLFESPIGYIWGMKAVQKSIGIILPTLAFVYLISFVVSILILSFIIYVLLDKHIRNYKFILKGNETTLTIEQKRQGLHRMRSNSFIALMLSLTPLLAYLCLIDIRDTVSMQALGLLKLNLLIINLFIGAIVGMLYADLAQILYRPLRIAIQLPLQGNVRSTMSALVRMAITTLFSCSLILLISHLYFDMDREINSRIISSISINVSDSYATSNFNQEVKSIFEGLALEYPLSLNLVWDDIDFSEHFSHIQKSIGNQEIDEYYSFNRLFKILYIIIFLLSLNSLSWLNIYLICRQFKIRIDNIFHRLQSLLRGEESFAGTVSLTAFDEIGYFAGYLNLLTMTSQKISYDVKLEGKNLLDSLDAQELNVSKLSNIVQGLEQDIVKINDSVDKEEEEHQIMDGGLHNVRSIILKVNGLLNNQRKYVDIIANQVNSFASLVGNVNQITEKADREAGVLAMSVGRGEEAVQSSILGMKEIAKASKAIENIVGAITKIAAQTSLLSMNAAIEAAHAGEHGSGFAVLAQEVRSLSESTTAQSRAIREQIELLITGVQSGLSISENTTRILSEITESIERNNVFVKSITNAMTEQHQGSRDIVQLIESSVSRGARIRILTDLQIRKSQDVINSMADFLQISRSIVVLSQESSDSIQSISQYVDAIGSSIESNKGISEKILADVADIDNAKTDIY